MPVPHISFRVPFWAAAVTSSMLMVRSETFQPQSRIRVSAESRVMPARMAPVSGGVITSSLMRSMMFIVPTSSMSRR